MSESKLSCLRCQGPMEIGFIPDATRGQEFWYEGEMPSSFIGSFMTGKRRFPVVANRCTACGTLELRAGP